MKRRTGQDQSITRQWRPATQAVRGGTARSEFGETSEAIFLTSGYAYDCAADAAARFAGEQDGMTYSRLQNPTVEMLEGRIALLEGAEACRTMATGMAAMTAVLLCQLQTGDHVVAGRAAFGSCRWLVDTLLPKFGIETTVVDARDPQAFADAAKANTKVFFFETPANPTMDIVDLKAVCDIARERGITSVVDNAFATPALQRPMEFGADVTAYSATKMMDGQGRVLAGAVCGTEDFITNTLLPFTRNTGPTLSAFNAWVVLKGLETLDLRIRRQSENSLKVGAFLETRVPRMLHPGLASHPQHALAMAQMDACGPIFAFEVADRKQAHALLDGLRLVDISNNIGDSRSLMTHPASTTHYGVSEDKRLEMGVTEGLLRFNVGLEDPQDVIEDLDGALTAAGL
ncbi:aminotransferase class I/II-fold pyridoxal phosphate-dependent enzyme [Sphingomonas sp. AAP5]|uniref:O-succinylhomoserine sulfhydrylase n=1 Tax=Sphingomonas glacialis TaxID=658225 RepID=A0ABQ3LED3_9SPHN|nr:MULTISPECIES: aminotransferase class I/II-fold pyridoxal phosphate-dependent enzyme [Sphingomonas]MDY7523073.1 aminotransferase class I/II-fold pyridoxal phosphate-dependent enzyme [Sphingomonas sp. 10B4]MEB0283438.1 aminotransferase class I/II-fold pyridoxal phosphate-dependent enzyme [Sphingomonas sp. 10B4]QBM76254.1 aminotransferase class I/II-fold pyridoxal phosphate-dependent enzyme [Sphingomonas sp. AAP5]GHH11740.1 O-succinylhomoserine sulfhydrylase [Sphingomonas glacialis]